MKRIVSLVLAIMLLTTGCSFIGHKDINDSEPIIPVSQQSEGDNNTALNSLAGTSTPGGINTSPGALSASAIDAASVSNSAISSLTSDETINGLVIDNGAGEGTAVIADNKNSLLMTLYYRNKEGLLVPVTRTVEKQEGLAKAAVSGLVDEAVTREQLDYYGLYPVLPKGTKIKGINIKNQLATIDFSKEFANLETKKDEQMAVASVIYTLTGFKTISDVRIRIDGKEISALKNGTDLSQLRNRENTFINTNETQLKEGNVKCDIFYVTDDSNNFNYMTPVSIQLERTDGNQLPMMIFNEMSKKPNESTYFTSIPEGTKLLSFDKQNNTAVLDFSSQISNYGGSAKEDSLLNQIYYTLNQFKGIERVKILIDGKETALPEGTEVAAAKKLPAIINKVIGN